MLRMLGPPILVAVLASTTGCKSRELDWDITFEPTSLSSSTVRLEAEIRRGRCPGRGTPRWREELIPARSVPEPPTLPPDDYCFSARAGDATCNWFASGATDVTLPMDDGASISIVVRSAPPMSNCTTMCMAGRCSGGGGTDAGTGDTCILGGCTQTCDDDCSASCVGGGCTMSCTATSDCSFDCPGGGCTILCEDTSNCSASCTGGDCRMTCQDAADCNFVCLGGSCAFVCEDAATDCITSCLPMDCTGP